ncbi:MAG: MFS transporter, partial [Actinomycetia bacterium]|nr:MFS transporter [Actinomycetes bacterium]
MLDTYRAVFRVPGSAAFCAAGFVLRYASAMYPIGLVLLVSMHTGRYSFAGVLSGCYIVANGVGTPLLARAVDRYGQSRVLLPVALAHIVAVAALVALVKTHAPQWTFVPPTALAALAYPATGPMVRARWSFVMGGRPELSTAYSLESTLDEVMYTSGPMITTVLATTLDPALVFALGAALVLGGSWSLTGQRGTEPPPQPAGAPAHRSALRYPGMLLLAFVGAGMGGVLAGMDVDS